MHTFAVGGFAVVLIHHRDVYMPVQDMCRHVSRRECPPLVVESTYYKFERTLEHGHKHVCEFSQFSMRKMGTQLDGDAMKK